MNLNNLGENFVPVTSIIAFSLSAPHITLKIRGNSASKGSSMVCSPPAEFMLIMLILLLLITDALISPWARSFRLLAALRQVDPRCRPSQGLGAATKASPPAASGLFMRLPNCVSSRYTNAFNPLLVCVFVCLLIVTHVIVTLFFLCEVATCFEVVA